MCFFCHFLMQSNMQQVGTSKKWFCTQISRFNGLFKTVKRNGKNNLFCLIMHWRKYGVFVNMESAKFRFQWGEWAAGSEAVVEAGLACYRPLGVSVGEQKCWSTVATTGCVHWCGISTVSAGVEQGWEVSGDAAQTGASCSMHENASTRMHFWGC